MNPAELSQRFLREAIIMSKLEHPNIIKIYDYNEDRGRPYIVMELVPSGETLEEVIKAGRLNPASVLPILQQLASALDYAYEVHGVLHRDIKPSNIFIAGNQVKLADFGIAIELKTNEHLTEAGQRLGTNSYMSPEQLLTAPLDRRSDIYSLGIVIFELLTGSLPFTNPDLPTLLRQRLLNQIPPLQTIRQDLGREWDQVLYKALDGDVGSRYATAQEFAQSFENLVKYFNSGNSKNFQPLSATTKKTQATSAAQQAAQFNYQGDEAYAKGVWPEAVHKYVQAVGLEPTFIEYRHNLACVYLRLGELVLAQEQAKEIIKLNPSSPIGYNELGVALEAQGFLGQAVVAFRNAIRCKPDKAAYHSNLAVVLNKIPDQSIYAEVAAREALHLDNQDYVAYKQLILALQNQGKFQLAAMVLQQARQANPTFVC
jgi:Flp pilus assembly protein TadD